MNRYSPKIMRDVKRIDFTEQTIHILQTYLNEMKFEDVVIMQSTGLLDKNGKEIFEGDILKRSREVKPSFVAVIEFSGGMFGGATIPYRNHWLPMNRLDCCDSDGGGYDEIIGNRYENPELLSNPKP